MVIDVCMRFIFFDGVSWCWYLRRWNAMMKALVSAEPANGFYAFKRIFDMTVKWRRVFDFHWTHWNIEVQTAFVFLLRVIFFLNFFHLENLHFFWVYICCRFAFICICQRQLLENNRWKCLQHSLAFCSFTRRSIIFFTILCVISFDSVSCLGFRVN